MFVKAAAAIPQTSASCRTPEIFPMGSLPGSLPLIIAQSGGLWLSLFRQSQH